MPPDLLMVALFLAFSFLFYLVFWPREDEEVYVDLMVFVVCCNRMRPKSRTEVSAYSVGGLLEVFYRCADRPGCEEKQEEAVHAYAEPMWKLLQS